MFFVGLSTLGAQQRGFQSKLLCELAKSIGYSQVDTLKEGIHNAGSAFGMPIIAEYDKNHAVTHIGFRLFGNDLKKEYVSDVYNFLERYFLEIYCWKDKTTLQRKLHDDKVMFTTGSFTDVNRIRETDQFSISMVENKFYEVAWADTLGTFLSLAFPVQYELLLGMPLAEIEQTMYSQITGASKAKEENRFPETEKWNDEVYRTVPYEKFHIESLNTCSYYYKRDKELSLVLDTIHADLAVQNIFHEVTRFDNPMQFEQNLYGFKKTEFYVTLQQWINYCKEQKLTIYTAIEEEYTDGFKLLLIAQSKNLGYNHMLSILIPRNFIEKPSAKIQASLNAFIPTHSVKNLFQKYDSKSKKKQF